MSGNASVWRLDETDVQEVETETVDYEKDLEERIVEEPDLLNEDLLIIGNQIETIHGTEIDILGVDVYGNIEIIELKRGSKSRKALSQGIEYAARINQLDANDVREIYKEENKEDFHNAFISKFGSIPRDDVSDIPEQFGTEHAITIVTSALDDPTIETLEYLQETYDVPINSVTYSKFSDKNNEYIMRRWWQDPTETRKTHDQYEWNGKDYYFTLKGSQRSWKDAKRFGYVQAGQGEEYRDEIKELNPGDRVFVYIPKSAEISGHGYVGVGIIQEEAVPVSEFKVEYDGKMIPIHKVPDIQSDDIEENINNKEKCEYLADVEWIDTKPNDEAVWEGARDMFFYRGTKCKFRHLPTLRILGREFDI
jgi:YHS domain-containing protein